MKILKYLTVWDDKGFPEMGDYRADAIWKGMSTLREVDGQLEWVSEENPEAPEWNSWAWVRSMQQTVAPVVTPAPLHEHFTS